MRRLCGWLASSLPMMARARALRIYALGFGLLWLLGADPGCGASRESPDTAATRGLGLPAGLGPPERPAPPSLEALLEEHLLKDAPFSRLRDSVRSYVGASVCWRLRSWGGEVSSGGFQTPAGRQPPSVDSGDVGRIRFVSAEFGADAGLVEVGEAGHPIIACLALFPRDDEALFLRGDEQRAYAPGIGSTTIEAELWGAVYAGIPVLWLHNCSVVEEAAAQ